MGINDWPVGERPRERMLERGCIALSDAELVAVLLGTGRRGLSAVDLVERLVPDIVVLDITMPRLDGLDVARRLRADGFQTRIIVLTVHEDADFLREALAVGAMGYVVKSQVVSDLPHALRKSVRQDRCGQVVRLPKNRSAKRQGRRLHRLIRPSPPPSAEGRPAR